MTVQVPAPLTVRAVPLTEHVPEAVYDTGRFEDAVAVSANGGSPYVWSGIGPNVMVWVVPLMITASVPHAAVAAVLFASPG